MRGLWWYLLYYGCTEESTSTFCLKLCWGAQSCIYVYLSCALLLQLTCIPPSCLLAFVWAWPHSRSEWLDNTGFKTCLLSRLLLQRNAPARFVRPFIHFLNVWRKITIRLYAKLFWVTPAWELNSRLGDATQSSVHEFYHCLCHSTVPHVLQIRKNYMEI